MSVYVGVMSGTSLDGLDVAVVRFHGRDERPLETEALAFHSAPYDSAFRARLVSLISEGDAEQICDASFEMGRRIGVAVRESLELAGLEASHVRAVGSHGQTIWHVPPSDERGSTLQIGNPSLVAEIAGVDVVADFRARDMAAGGHGAPLTAYTDRIMFESEEPRLIQNIGGFANVTYLPGRAGGDPIAFDTGPGVALIDGAVRTLIDGASFDRDGELAASGEVNETALQEWLEDPYFAARPPKSTGREMFSEERLRRWLARHAELAVEDIVATITELTARSIADAYRFVPQTRAGYVCGGGASNPTLIARLQALAAPIEIRDLSGLGVDPNAREAIAFALLARQHVLGIPANATWATGAAGRRVLGTLTPA
ncbi:MAG: anhydro-N-acetylmuramic acid kinase [Gemmatimonadota bacterium]|nr:anhydro-N-acetylmuramic acid kinase [Gemmatimonadota bacterium]